MDNNGTTSPLPSLSQIYSQIISGDIIERQAFIASTTILFYAALFHLPDEMEYIWKKKFSLPTLLYLLSKYPVFLYQGFLLAQAFWPGVDTARECNNFDLIIGTISVLPFIGVQGLVAIRTYALCQGYRPMAIALALTFFIPLVLQIYGLTQSECTSQSPESFIFLIVHNGLVALSEILAFIGVFYQAWGIWKAKKSVSLESNETLVTSILEQGFIRFGFVVFISTTASFLLIFASGSIAGIIYTAVENVLTSVLICEFTLDLRKRNEQKPAPDQSLSLGFAFQDNNPAQASASILGRLRENILEEWGEHNSLVDDNVQPGRVVDSDEAL